MLTLALRRLDMMEEKTMPTDTDLKTKIKTLYADLRREEKDGQAAGVIQATKVLRPDWDSTTMFEEAKSDMSLNLAEERTEDSMFSEWQRAKAASEDGFRG